MDRTARRRLRLQKLVEEFGTHQRLAERAGTAPSYISQLLHSRSISNKMAERLERAANKPSGWMDKLEGDAATGSVESGFREEDLALLRRFLSLPDEIQLPLRMLIQSLHLTTHPTLMRKIDSVLELAQRESRTSHFSNRLFFRALPRAVISHSK